MFNRPPTLGNPDTPLPRWELNHSMAVHPNSTPMIIARDDLERWFDGPHKTAFGLARPNSDDETGLLTNTLFSHTSYGFNFWLKV
jgi:hypothetical protein